MRFHHESTYSAPVGEVFAMLTDQSFREQVCGQVKSSSHAVDVAAGPPVVVTVDQDQPVRNVPPYAAKLVGEIVRIHQIETWADQARATLDLTIPGKPGQLTATRTLTEHDGVTTDSIDGELKVNIPLVGGKLEQVIGGLLTGFLAAESEVGATWLSGVG
ncbi:MAG: DUF2505 domain-containing protein [Nocardioidaceae bacterium]